MSAALSPYLGSWKRSLLPIFAYEVTDETFAVHSVRFPQAGAHPTEALLINVISQASWVIGTWLGIAAGSLIQDVKPFGLDYALPAMFIALLVFQVKDRRYVAVAIAGGLLSVILVTAGLSQWNVIVATLIAATLGVLIDAWTKPPSS
jgi:predicted branched-subunit amino acid permease